MCPPVELRAVIAAGTVKGEFDPQAEWLLEMTLISVDDLVCGGWPRGAGISLAGLWCQLRLPLGCVDWGATWGRALV